MEEDDVRAVFGCVFFVGAILMIVMFFFGCHVGETGQRTEAIKAGAGRWASDTRTGETTFEYGIPKRGGDGR